MADSVDLTRFNEHKYTCEVRYIANANASAHVWTGAMQTQGKYISLVRHLGKRLRLCLRILPSLLLSMCKHRLHLHLFDVGLRNHILCIMKTCLTDMFLVSDHVFPVHHSWCPSDCQHVDCHDGEYLSQGGRNREGMDPTGRILICAEVVLFRACLQLCILLEGHHRYTVSFVSAIFIWKHYLESFEVMTTVQSQKLCTESLASEHLYWIRFETFFNNYNLFLAIIFLKSDLLKQWVRGTG